jgi:ornithine carbamoyltransferase
MTEFRPPIASRTTEELLKIAGAVEKWNNEAIEQARTELQLRNVSADLIDHAKYISNKEDKYEALKNAKESYTLGDFVFTPVWTTFEVLFSWELKKDGFLRKAEQQKWLRIILGLLILALIIYINW